MMNTVMRHLASVRNRSYDALATAWRQGNCGSRDSSHHLSTYIPHRSSSSINIESKGIWRPEGFRMGWSSKVVAELLPHTSEILLWRGNRSLESIAVGYCTRHNNSRTNSPPEFYKNNSPSSILNSQQGNNEEKRTEESWLEIILPFSDQPDLRDSMVRADGKSILYGKLFEIFDALAADVAYRHCGGGGMQQYTIVTACVDGVKAFQKIDVFNDLKLQAYLTFAGQSSMEVSIDVSAADAGSRMESLMGRIQFIMVARDASQDIAARIPKLIPSNEALAVEFESGRLRAQQRKTLAKESLNTKPPRPDEIDFMHKLYLESQTLKRQKNQLIQLISKSVGDSNSENIANKHGNLGHAEINKKNFKWLKNTVFKSIQLQHVQDRNIHGKVFGGHIIKTSFDLAWIAASCFFGTEEPVFFCVDDIQFVKPVSVGSVMEYSTAVIYSSGDSIVIQVDAFSVNCKTMERARTNVLSYVFKHPVKLDQSSDLPSYPQVIPKEYDEFVLFLEGKRSFERLMSRNQ